MTGAVDGNGSHAGGLVGDNQGTVTDTYSLAEVVGDTDVGGLVGYNDETVERSFAAEIVAGTESVGGFVGFEGYSSETNCYWDIDTTGLEFTDGGAEGLTTGEMQGTEAETVMDGFDFGGVWTAINGEYPVLSDLDQTAQLDARPLTREPPTSIHEAMTGDGSGRDPYIVTGVDELEAIDEDPVAFYTLGNNIDASAFDSTTVAATAFSGVLDGAGRVIDSLTISQQDSDQVGLFGEIVTSGTVENLTLNRPEITGNNKTGGLAGQSLGIVRGVVIVSGTVSGSSQTGGLIGENRGAVEYSGFEGTTTGSNDVGGLVGYNSNSIQSSYSTGSVEGTDLYTGGLVGQNQGPVADTYSLAEVVGNEDVGGLIGYNNDPAERSFAAGSVSGSSSVGGFAGTTSLSSETNCYWDEDATGQSNSAGGAEALSTDQMQGDFAIVHLEGFDFEETWNAVEGEYPELTGFDDIFGPVSLSVSDLSIPVDGEGDLSISAGSVTEITIEDLWTDWSVSATTDGTFTDNVSENGTATVSWASTQLTADPTITIAPPARYVGGEYILSIEAVGEDGTVNKTVTVSIV